MALFEKGAANPKHTNPLSGRQRGPGKIPKAIKDVVLQAAKLKGDRVDPVTGKRARGGIVGYLSRLPDELFIQLLTRCMPKEVAAEIDITARAVSGRPVESMSDEELRQVIAASDKRLGGPAS
jgi:hypothetical protein